MTIRQYLALMAAGTAVLWSAVWLIVRNVDPHRAPAAVFVVFYVTLFMALTGAFSVVGFLMRVALLKQQLVVSRHVAISFRQSLLIALLVSAALYLSSKQMLNWLSALGLVAAMTVLEFLLISPRVRRPPPPPST